MDNGITHGEALLINMENMFIQACIVNFGLIFPNNASNSLTIHLKIILESQSQPTCQDKYLKGTLWKDFKDKDLENMWNSIALLETSNTFNKFLNFKSDILTWSLKKTLFKILIMLL